MGTILKEPQVVAVIKNGTVIDHIAAGNAMKIVHLLDLHNHPKRLSIGLNLPSEALGCKDLIKVEDRELSPQEVNKVAILAPDATISIVKDFEIANKFQIELPDVIEGIIHCKNEQCITNSESIIPIFYIHKQRREPLIQCKYCCQKLTLPEAQECSL